jgi:hypothetical protein
MAAPVPLRSDFDGPRLRTLAKRSRDPNQSWRRLWPPGGHLRRRDPHRRGSVA